MSNVLLIRYGEIHLKGLNRPFFERLLVNNIKRAVKPFGLKVLRGDARFIIEDIEENADVVAQAVCKVFGVHSVSIARKCSKDFDEIRNVAKEIFDERIAYEAGNITFKVEAKRSDKRYPMNSMMIAREVGGYILQNAPDFVKVDVHEPKIKVFVEVRMDGAYVYSKIIPAAGGLPVGASGKATLLLSGGIDSPVAGYMIAKRGVILSAVYFHSFPYTGEQAKQKVIDLAKIVSEYAGGMRLYVVGFTQIQTLIHENCPEDEITLIMRRYMMKIAERIAKMEGAGALITGESIGQVASQTMDSLGVTDAAVNMCVFRPLIGMDKEEIMERSRKIGTYETSILPYEDCCTVFVAKHPKTRPVLSDILESEKALDEEPLIQKALEEMEIIEI